jgi:prepilin-type N-terminal cleavage/methylation domain-containing protein
MLIRCRAFTLIELLVVAIIAVLTSQRATAPPGPQLG